MGLFGRSRNKRNKKSLTNNSSIETIDLDEEKYKYPYENELAHPHSEGNNDEVLARAIDTGVSPVRDSPRQAGTPEDHFIFTISRSASKDGYGRDSSPRDETNKVSAGGQDRTDAITRGNIEGVKSISLDIPSIEAPNDPQVMPLGTRRTMLEESVLTDGYVLMEDANKDDEELLKSLVDMYEYSDENHSARFRLCGHVFGFYDDRDTYTGRRQSKVMLWAMLAILLSNPIIGVYNMYNFTNWHPWDNDVVEDDGWLSMGNTHDWYTGARALSWRGLLKGNEGGATNSNLKYINEDHSLSVNVDLLQVHGETISRNVQRYAFYEIFGELIFLMASALIITIYRLRCDRHKVQSIFPCLALIYMVIYKCLAFYILMSSVCILVTYLFVNCDFLYNNTPNLVINLFNVKDVDITDNVQRDALKALYLLDTGAHKWLLLYSIENIYITLSDIIELVYILYRFTTRWAKKITNKHDLSYYSLNSITDAIDSTRFCNSCSYTLMDALPTSNNYSPSESYIRNMYHNNGNVGTYLDNINIKDYQTHLNKFAAKLLK